MLALRAHQRAGLDWTEHTGDLAPSGYFLTVYRLTYGCGYEARL